MDGTLQRSPAGAATALQVLQSGQDLFLSPVQDCFQVLWPSLMLRGVGSTAGKVPSRANRLKVLLIVHVTVLHDSFFRPALAQAEAAGGALRDRPKGTWDKA